jgi:glycine/D-amino acid oxidase-like deaminating enzyme
MRAGTHGTRSSTQARQRMGAPAPLPHAPWQEDLSDALRSHLTLDCAPALPVASVDVVVVGGGVAGLSAALAAARAGAQTLLLEAKPSLGHGATGRSAGILSAGINMALADLARDDEQNRELWRATTRTLLALAAGASNEGSLLRATLTGAYTLAGTPSAVRHLAREARARTALGLRAELQSPAQVAERTAGRLDTRAVISALWLPDEGRIHPLTLLAQLARDARAAGAVLRGGAPVAAHTAQGERGRRRGWRVVLADGSVLAARGLIVATGPTCAPRARIYALAFRADLPDDFPLFWDAAPYTYSDFRPGDGRLTVSGGRYGRAGGSPREARYYQRLADAARRWLPELAAEEPAYAWAADLAVAPDMVPELRDLRAGAPGYAIEGLGALGVLPGMVLGERAGQAVARAVR